MDSIFTDEIEKAEKLQKRPPKLMLDADLLQLFCSAYLSDAQTGQLMRAVIAYFDKGTMLQTDDIAIGMSFETIKKAIDSDIDKYAVKCKTNKANASKNNKRNLFNELDECD